MIKYVTNIFIRRKCMSKLLKKVFIFALSLCLVLGLSGILVACTEEKPEEPPTHTVHVDENNDGKCDECGEPMGPDNGGSGCGGCGSISFGEGMLGGGTTLLCIMALFAAFAFVRKKSKQ